MKEVVQWIDERQLENIFTTEYWNDIEEEKKKPFWIADGNYEKCLNYLNTSGLLDEYYHSEKFISNTEELKVLDLAAGIGWTSALISKLSRVSEVHAVEISRHRLITLFEHSIKMLAGTENKIYRYIGSFYDIKLEDKSIDVIYMSQAFHHAEKPLHLLFECDRVLKENGRIIIVGEHRISIFMIFKQIVKNLIVHRKFNLNFYKLFLPDKISGDHYYRVSDYYFLFQSMGYQLNHYVLPTGHITYVADKIYI
jgi:SAM-dependent methyltransferase